MSFWRARMLSSIVAIVVALAWFTSTNHCLLGLVNDGQGTVASACHCCKAAGSQHNGSAQMLSCCQGLLSSASELAQTNVKFSPVLLLFQLAASDQLFVSESLQIANPGAEYDTGPPKENCFVSIVLKRALPEHAPPLSV